ncbi:MAG: hypothetical protein V3S89_01675 [Desulfobacterales bacterium]
MAKVFRPSNRESSILSRIESAQEHARRRAISNARECIEPLSNAIAMKLVENELVETTDKAAVEEQITRCVEKLSRSEDFDVDFQIAPFRQLVTNPHVVSLYITAFVIEQLIDHRSVVDIFGSDTDIYVCINQQIAKYIPS